MMWQIGLKPSYKIKKVFGQTRGKRQFWFEFNYFFCGKYILVVILKHPLDMKIVGSNIYVEYKINTHFNKIALIISNIAI